MHLCWHAHTHTQTSTVPPPMEWMMKKHCRQSQNSAALRMMSDSYSRYCGPYTLCPTALETQTQGTNILYHMRNIYNGDGGGGFFLVCKDLGERFTFSACAFYFIFKWRVAHAHLFHSRPGSVYSGSASWDGCDRVFPDECRMSSFPDKIPTLCLDSGIVSPLRLHWVKGVCMFRYNLPPAVLAEWPGSFTCHCSNTGVGRTLNESQHTKLTLEKKILPPLLRGLELATFWSWVRH